MHVFWKVHTLSGGPAYVDCSIVSPSSQQSGHMTIGYPVPSASVIGPCYLSVDGSFLDIPYTLGGQVCPTLCGTFRHYRGIRRELVITNLPSYRFISNAAVVNAVYN
jgi:hypothetical protein